MPSIDLPPQSDALEPSLLEQSAVPLPALRALQRLCELEREFMLLRDTLAESSAQTLPATVWQDQVTNLLSRVVLFRVALADPPLPQFMDTVANSGRDDSPATVYRALPG